MSYQPLIHPHQRLVQTAQAPASPASAPRIHPSVILGGAALLALCVGLMFRKRTVHEPLPTVQSPPSPPLAPSSDDVRRIMSHLGKRSGQVRKEAKNKQKPL